MLYFYSLLTALRLELHLPLDDAAFEDCIGPIVGSPWEAQANEPDVNSAGRLIRQCLLQQTSTKRPRSNDQSGGSLPEFQQAYELEPNSKRPKTTNHQRPYREARDNSQNNASDKGKVPPLSEYFKIANQLQNLKAMEVRLKQPCGHKHEWRYVTYFRNTPLLKAVR